MMVRLLLLIVMTLLLSVQGGPAFASEERAETLEAVVESTLFSKQSKSSKIKQVLAVVTLPILVPVDEPVITALQTALPLRRHIYYRVLLI